ncbi:MAG: hydantoinase B/oxoprolinase family protein [Deltaproteobacteria bacterium]|nr:hydantoinase B/oxoprolinase family protein [Deltaproteobacteria bacterium]
MKNTDISIDPVTFEIIRHRLFQIVDEAIIALENVSGSPITNEGHDMMVSLYRSNGGLLVGGVGFLHHLTSAAQAVKHIIKEYSEDPGMFEGDIFLLNDSYTAALHPPDVYLISPIYYEGELVSFVANFVHVTDIGAIDPGGFCPRAETSFHEGFVSRGLKIMERGKIRKDVIDTILNMVRDPGMVALDLKSQIAANNVATRRMHELLDEYGKGTVDQVGSQLIDQSENLIRQRLRELPDGTWRARQYIDHPGKTYTIKLSMTKKDDTLTYDFTGSSEQAPVGINCSYWASWGAMFAPIFPLLAHDITWNEGITDPIKIIAPEGSIVNAKRPAPLTIATISAIQIINNLSTTCLSKMFGASRKYRDRVTAVWHGSHAHITTHGRDGSGNYFVSPLTDTFGGAAGARAFKDGVDIGGEIPNVVSRWGNAETHEEMLPLIYVYRRLVKDSGGPGKYRGGVCHEYAITPYGSIDQSLGTVLYGKGVNAPQSTGVFGGYPGCNVDYIIFRNSVELKQDKLPTNLDSSSGKRIEHVQWGVFDLEDGDMLYIRFMGGGGYGDPIDRNPELVRRDVEGGFVSSECAEEIYGVILAANTGQVQIEDTKKRRETIRKERLGGRNDRIHTRAVGIQETNHQISEYLQLVDSDGNRSIQCKWCGKIICNAAIQWKSGVPSRKLSITKAGPLRAKNNAFFLHEFYCPFCATLLDTEVILEGDEPLHDEIFYCSKQNLPKDSSMETG